MLQCDYDATRHFLRNCARRKGFGGLTRRVLVTAHPTTPSSQSFQAPPGVPASGAANAVALPFLVA